MTRYWLVHYVNREDYGDLLWGYNWREAVLIEDGSYSFGCGPHKAIEANMFDKQTGKNVGDTRNFCLWLACPHEDCGPRTLIAEVP